MIDILRSPRWLATLCVFGMSAVILSALAFEHLAGYIPCKLCLAQREPYYAAIPVGILAMASLGLGWPRCVATGLLAIVGLLMLYTVALAGFHSGVEWGWWPGPADCGATAGNISGDVNDLLGDLTAKRPPSCDEAAVRFFGLSFAGWNVLASAGLALFAFVATYRAYGSSSVSQ